jgi:hypothetical protein
MKRIILTAAAAAAILTGSVAAAAPAFASSSPATVKVVIHAADHSDTSNVCSVGAIGPDCVWAHDNLSRQIVATPNGNGTWTVNITDNGSFSGFADPVTGAALASNGPVSGTYQLTVTGGTPDAKNLPSQQGDMGTTAMIAQLFGVSPSAVAGGDYSYSYQNGGYVQDTNGEHGGLRGGAVAP